LQQEPPASAIASQALNRLSFLRSPEGIFMRLKLTLLSSGIGERPAQ
jgi:hypothetical protein